MPRPQKKIWKDYLYKAIVMRVVDGDSFDIDINLGFDTHAHQRIRLNAVDTPEITGKEKAKGLKVKKYVEGLILNKKVLIRTFRMGRYGRYACEIFIEGDKKKPLSKHLIKKRMAKRMATRYQS
jgi:micrococcal nuclease